MRKHKKLLVVEDDPGLQSQMRWCFDQYEVVIAGDRQAALNELRLHEPAVVTLDLGLPPDPANASEGLATLDEILKLAPHTKVIVVTGNEDRENALKSVALGAYDFYQKPIDVDVLAHIIDRACQLYELEEENRRLSQHGGRSFEGIIAVGPEMSQVCRTVEKVAPTDATTLILGESGTGKELIAQALHRLSDRSEARFVAINCAAIPDTLLESELFGYEKGAYTGAAKQTKGKIEYADGGTLFLDEVGDLSMPLQAKLLRFLQERVIERIGGRSEIPVDVRVICATHQDLRELIKTGRFREDLYFRICEITLNVPPLRDRRGDTLALARFFLDKHSMQQGRACRLTEQAIAAIEAHSWPGNVRELENRIKRAVIMAEHDRVEPADLELAPPEHEVKPRTLKQIKMEAEREALVWTLNYVDGNLTQVADLLGITRPTLYAMLDKYGLRK